jgi:hypothetical protein
MNKETLRMQLLSGVITESEYKTKLEENSTKEPLNENFLELIKNIEDHIKDYIKNAQGMPGYVGGQLNSEEQEKVLKLLNTLKYLKQSDEYKKSLNENFVGMGMVGNIFDREKTDYELAFEHFAKGTSLNEEMEDEDEFDLNQAFKNSPETAPYEDVLGVIESYEDEDILNDFKTEFPEGEPVNKRDYSDFSISLIDDMSEVGFIQANWISIFDEDIFDKAGLNESNKPGTAKERPAMAKKARAGKDIGEK